MDRGLTLSPERSDKQTFAVSASLSPDSGWIDA
jgi:hypothetical protein